jgi:hypothetical protein
VTATRVCAGSTSQRSPRRRRLPEAIALCIVWLALCAGHAEAVILPAQTIDGPNENIVGFGGAAMAEDGTGGLVYLKRVNGVAHVFASQYLHGTWQAPVRVDSEESFAAGWPRIGAAEDGKLIVVWATPFATEHARPVYELLGAELGPGSQTFGQATIVDPDIREATGTSPDLAVSSTGAAEVVYRVVNFQSSVPLLRPGDVVESVRMAAYDGERWSGLGAINRDSGLSMRPPTEANAPRLAIGPTGNGIVGWQEPESNGVARIWARRVFGHTVNYVMPATATTYAGAPITNDADAPSVAISKLGQAEVAYRQSYAPGSPLPGPRIFTNTLPDGESESGAEFLGAQVADAAVPGGKAALIGRPDVDVDERRESRLLYDNNGGPRVVEYNDKGVATTLSLGSPFAGSQLGAPSELASASVMNPAGGGVSAWPSVDPQGRPSVGVREDFPDGAVQTGLLSGGAGGPIGELAVGRSGLGDGLVAFQQGPIGDAAIVAAQVTAPPAQFAVSAPKGWVKPSQAKIVWAPAESADGPLNYTVVLDGSELSTPGGALRYTLDRHSLAGGTHSVQVLVTDIFGRSLLSAPAKLKVDAKAPTVRVLGAARGHAVSVRVSDPGSGLLLSAVKVSFGDGHGGHGHRSFSHRYSRPGSYELTVSARDQVGNRVTLRRRLRIA